MRTKEQLKAFRARALETTEPPAYESTDDVPVLGDQLTKPIHWQGRQWAVTAYGIEARDGKYLIKSADIWDETNGWGLIEHMDEKEWVDLPDFVEALRIARARWPESEA